MTLHFLDSPFRPDCAAFCLYLHVARGSQRTKCQVRGWGGSSVITMPTTCGCGCGCVCAHFHILVVFVNLKCMYMLFITLRLYYACITFFLSSDEQPFHVSARLGTRRQYNVKTEPGLEAIAQANMCDGCSMSGMRAGTGRPDGDLFYPGWKKFQKKVIFYS